MKSLRESHKNGDYIGRKVELHSMKCTQISEMKENWDTVREEAEEGVTTTGFLGAWSSSGDLWACRASVGWADFPKGTSTGVEITAFSSFHSFSFLQSTYEHQGRPNYSPTLLVHFHPLCPLTHSQLNNEANLHPLTPLSFSQSVLTLTQSEVVLIRQCSFREILTFPAFTFN